ncbi:bacteriohopanetetrol glucosamine biosynthesis glycosyltransferase HpnI [Acidisoma cellulosilytica]|uniref:Bacteriohopanetetrol glucosamine biosynthesis glycosyltransferase HpnI n=1 Tax=Acidisoma cellulosilyticum TaxID=2802395 RepID=A0A963Z001_9PROT|nr:bacteriohopanetetrol glucosamine biosynthesis glycosyltransferase HpnI [Acidisoma cellulosilyticum]MCB8880273.1 bacteriohopanetetrol glucosamine biosynthesis glycosyltransferase HpnI [Acidisoma cellulosilyticum]
MTLLADVTALFSAAGLVQAGGAWQALKRFNQRARPQLTDRPAVTILKPLKGDEPLLEAALASFCTQSYPEYQIVFGVQDANDPAIPVVEKLQAIFPNRDITLIVDETQHGGNRKIANLINMWSAARHDVIVLADSDVHVTPHFLERVVAGLAEPDIGLVTALYTGVASRPGIVGPFGAAQINHIFLPGVMVGRVLGRQDCLGAAIALRRETLDAVGGFPALLPHLADDFALGRLVRATGQRIALISGLVVTTVSEDSIRALFAHELRWARTIRALEPVTYATTALQFPVFWGLMTILTAGFAWWSVIFAASVWILRALLLQAVTRQLGRGRFSGWLLPAREIFSLSVLVASYLGNRVVWRGNSMAAVSDRQQFGAGSGWLGFGRLRFGKTGRLTRGINQL